MAIDAASALPLKSGNQMANSIETNFLEKQLIGVAWQKSAMLSIIASANQYPFFLFMYSKLITHQAQIHAINSLPDGDASRKELKLFVWRHESLLNR